MGRRALDGERERCRTWRQSSQRLGFSAPSSYEILREKSEQKWITEADPNMFSRSDTAGLNTIETVHISLSLGLLSEGSHRVSITTLI